MWIAPLEIAHGCLALAAAGRRREQLSGGERRRVALCKVLLQRPDLLLLDEPTNHLDAESVAWLEQHLQEFPGTIVAITHDRYFSTRGRLDPGTGPRRGSPVEGQLLVH